MLALSSSALIGLVLLTTPVQATERAPLPSCEARTRYVELAADTPNTPTEVCIRPELSLTLLFDAKLAHVEVEGRERFRRVMVADDMVTLVASEALHDGERVPMTVFFQDSAVPTNATFVLVVHPSQAERQVEVARHERTLASLRLGEQQARAEAQQCREDKARLQTECSGQSGLTSLILDGWLGDKGVAARGLKAVTPHPGDSLVAKRIISYRATGTDGRGRVAVAVDLSNQGAEAWTLMGAALVSAKGQELTGLKVAPLEPIPPVLWKRIVVELEMTEQEARGPFTLKLWSGDAGAGSVEFEGVTFP